MPRSVGFLGASLVLILATAPVAVAEESNPSLVIAETVDDPLIVERSTDLEPLIEAASGLATLTLNRVEEVRRSLLDFGGFLRSVRARHRAATASLVAVNRLVADQVRSADQLRADYARSLDRLDEEDRVRLEEDARVLRNMSAVVRILANDDWVCPVDGTIKFYDSWHEVRASGKPHQGVDLIGFRGARLRAPVDGRIQFYWDTVGGRSFSLHGDNGDYYFGTHLLRFGSPGRVKAGDPIGQVGSGGNATGNHLHFEYHPAGRGNQVNPYQIVDAHCGDRLPIDVPLDHAANGD